jgi:hypothetical protein
MNKNNNNNIERGWYKWCKGTANLYNLIIVRHTTVVSVFNKKTTKGFSLVGEMILINTTKPHNSLVIVDKISHRMDG